MNRLKILTRVGFMVILIGSGAWTAAEKGPEILVLHTLAGLLYAYACGSSDGFDEVAGQAVERDLAEVDYETPSGAPRIIWKDTTQ